MFALKVIVLLVVLGLLVWKSFRPLDEKEIKSSYNNFPYAIRKGYLIAAALFLVCSALVWGCVGQVEPGYRGVVVRMGAVTGRVLPEGIYAVVPLIERVEPMSVQVMALPTEASSASKDMQVVNTKMTLNFQLSPDMAASVYQSLRHEAAPRVIEPSIQESIKAATALFDAESLIARRDEVRSRMKELLVNKLQGYGIIVRDVSITNLDFSEAYNNAIESKAIALQNVETAKRNLEKVKMEQQAEIEKAKAQAEALRVQKMNVTQELISLRQIEVHKAWVDKWNGATPTIISGDSGMFLQIPAPASK